MMQACATMAPARPVEQDEARSVESFDDVASWVPGQDEAARSSSAAIEPGWGIEWCVDFGDRIELMTKLEIWMGLAAGRLRPDLRVWRDGRAWWLPIAEVDELTGLPEGDAAELELEEVVSPVAVAARTPRDDAAPSDTESGVPRIKLGLGPWRRLAESQSGGPWWRRAVWLAGSLLIGGGGLLAVCSGPEQTSSPHHQTPVAEVGERGGWVVGHGRVVLGQHHEPFRRAEGPGR